MSKVWPQVAQTVIGARVAIGASAEASAKSAGIRRRSADWVMAHPRFRRCVSLRVIYQAGSRSLCANRQGAAMELPVFMAWVAFEPRRNLKWNDDKRALLSLCGASRCPVPF
jgi:hypothetical protein